MKTSRERSAFGTPFLEISTAVSSSSPEFVSQLISARGIFRIEVFVQLMRARRTVARLVSCCARCSRLQRKIERGSRLGANIVLFDFGDADVAAGGDHRVEVSGGLFDRSDCLTCRPSKPSRERDFCSDARLENVFRPVEKNFKLFFGRSISSLSDC